MNMNGEPADKRSRTEEMNNDNNNHLPEQIGLPKILRIGSRKSQLALFQSNFVMDILKRNHPEIKYEIVAMTTTGDNILNTPLSKIGQKSLFTKELEVALEENEVDIVVHSLKDLPTTLPPGMVIAAICRRGNPFDAVVLSSKNQRINQSLESLPEGSVIGTSSLRRIAQLKYCYPRLKYESIRGNLNTRLRKLDDDSTYEALILAAAGLERMDLSSRISAVLSPDVCMYAVGQGALAIECKADDLKTVQLLSEIADAETVLRCVAERAFMKTLEGGCSVPVAVFTAIENEELVLKGGVFSLDGSQRIVKTLRAHLNENTFGSSTEYQKQQNFCGIVANHLPQQLLHVAQKLGTDLAESMLEIGAGKILEQARQQNESS